MRPVAWCCTDCIALFVRSPTWALQCGLITVAPVYQSANRDLTTASCSPFCSPIIYSANRFEVFTCASHYIGPYFTLTTSSDSVTSVFFSLLDCFYILHRFQLSSAKWNLTEILYFNGIFPKFIIHIKASNSFSVLSTSLASQNLRLLINQMLSLVSGIITRV